MNKRIRVNGVLYEAVSPRRSRRMNEKTEWTDLDLYDNDGHDEEAYILLPNGDVPKLFSTDIKGSPDKIFVSLHGDAYDSDEYAVSVEVWNEDEGSQGISTASYSDYDRALKNLEKSIKKAKNYRYDGEPVYDIVASIV